jgi:hypothetical protein
MATEPHEMALSGAAVIGMVAPPFVWISTTDDFALYAASSLFVASVAGGLLLGGPAFTRYAKRLLHSWLLRC